MIDYGVIQGSRVQAVPLIIGKDTVYVHTAIRQLPKPEPPDMFDEEGNIIGQDEHFYDNWDMWEYHEIQYGKDEYLTLIAEQTIENEQNIDYIASMAGVELEDEQEEITLDVKKRRKLREIGRICQQIIYAGIIVGDHHFSLTNHDQFELFGQADLIKEGAPAVPYHVDKELCRMFPAAEFMEIVNAAKTHIFFHRTYCNHLNVWIRRTKTEDELNQIEYTGEISELPEDLAVNFMELIQAVQNYE
jgi:hypothetical protein